MFVFIVRRLIAGVFIILGSSFICYMLMTQAGNPLEFVAQIPDPTQRAATERFVREALNLDTPPVWRYFQWLWDVVIHQDLGDSARSQQPINGDVVRRVFMTLKLVTAAFVLSVTTGVSVGIVTAIRQYSGFDYLVTFFTFVFFSLPVFWVAVILKAFGGIDFNDWLRDNAHFSTTFVVILAAMAAILTYTSAGGTRLRKLAVAAIGTAAVVGLLAYISATEWLRNPGLGPVVIALTAVAIAVGVTAVTAGLRNQQARNSALAMAAIGAVGFFPLQWVFKNHMSIWTLLGLAVLTVAIGVAVGHAFGGFDKGLSARTAAITGFLVSVVLFVDRTMQSWDDYSATSVIRNRPIKTIGDRESRLEGDFWLVTNDTFSHLILPTLALMLISVATYTRYSRGSMLEVLNHDYIRTARAKGLTERTVVVRHAFRNAMIPLATVVALDTGGLLGGAIVTETVFQWNAMGKLFNEGLRELDPNRVMAFFLVIAVLTIVFNLIADLMYTVLDPRIRVMS